jgi:hypothetical protein
LILPSFRSFAADGLATSGPLALVLELLGLRAANIRHRLVDLIVTAIRAVICDCDSSDEVEAFARSMERWLGSFLDLCHGVPPHDTLERVFVRLDPDRFEKCFAD